MKEYKVVNWKMGIARNNARLENTLNQYGKLGWKAIHIGEHYARIVFERDKNR